jgi:hypothetical protein
MKLPAVVLTASAATNVACFALLALRPALAPPAFRDFFARLGGGAAPAAAAAPKTATPQPEAAAPGRVPRWSGLATDDLPALIARLRGAGFSSAMIRAIVGAQIEARFRDRMNALTGVLADTPFWKPEPTNSNNNPAFFEQLNQIYRERARLLRQLLGDDGLPGLSSGDVATQQRRQFGDLPKNKIELVQRIVEDYAEMTSQVRAAMQGITLPEDREKLALLEREKRADLAALLTPAELEEYEMRNSTTTSRLRQALTLMDASEAEFRAIFQVQQQFADALYPTVGSLTAVTAQQRTEAQQKVAEMLKSTLGEQRYSEFARASDYEYQNLVRLGQGANVPSETLVRVYGLRDTVVNESTRIYEDKQLSTEQKRAALTALGQNAKAQVVAALGADAANAYFQSASWITAPERGWIPRRSPGGTGFSYTSLPLPSAPRPPGN